MGANKSPNRRPKTVDGPNDWRSLQLSNKGAATWEKSHLKELSDAGEFTLGDRDRKT